MPLGEPDQLAAFLGTLLVSYAILSVLLLYIGLLPLMNDLNSN